MMTPAEALSSRFFRMCAEMKCDAIEVERRHPQLKDDAELLRSAAEIYDRLAKRIAS